MPNRNYQPSVDKYRYGFNGKENDNETVSTGEGTQDYGLRIYNPSLGKFLSVDPLTKEYPWYTPYQFAGNKPIRFIDRDGAEEWDNSGTVTPYIKPLPNVSGAARIMNFITNNTIIALYNGASATINAIPAAITYLGTPGNDASTAVVALNDKIHRQDLRLSNYIQHTNATKFFNDSWDAITTLENYDLPAQLLVSHYVFKPIGVGSSAELPYTKMGNNPTTTYVSKMISPNEYAFIETMVKTKLNGVFSEKALSSSALRKLSSDLGGVEVAQVFIKTEKGGYYNVFYGTKSKISIPAYGATETPYLINHVHPAGTNIPSLSDNTLLQNLQKIQADHKQPVQSSSQIIPAEKPNASFDANTPTSNN